ncbi:MAG: endonuclease III [Nitrospirae bacterium]|nr:endonuclease III [Nitrospirota bacterium]
MNTHDIHKLIPILKKQVQGLDVPWLENMVHQDRLNRDPFKVLISCILSLRTQDKTTGEASERLFKLATDVKSMSLLPVKKIEKAIYPVGFYRVKAERIKELCITLIKEYNSRVPDEIDELLKLKGVGRKTANLVITLGYNKPGICVDTHVHRITNRWGYVKTTTPEKTEFALREKLPKRYWLEINGLLVAFGQGICRPVSPMCSSCDIEKFCSKVGVVTHR